MTKLTDLFQLKTVKDFLNLYWTNCKTSKLSACIFYMCWPFSLLFFQVEKLCSLSTRSEFASPCEWNAIFCSGKGNKLFLVVFFCHEYFSRHRPGVIARLFSVEWGIVKRVENQKPFWLVAVTSLTHEGVIFEPGMNNNYYYFQSKFLAFLPRDKTLFLLFFPDFQALDVNPAKEGWPLSSLLMEFRFR